MMMLRGANSGDGLKHHTNYFSPIVIILLLAIQVYCSDVDTLDATIINDLREAGDLKIQINNMIENLIKIDNYLDEWAIETITDTNQLDRMAIKSLENEIDNKTIQINELTKKLNENLFKNITVVDDECQILKKEIELLNKKYNNTISKLQILGQFYDSYYLDVVNKKIKIDNSIIKLVNDIKLKVEAIEYERIVSEYTFAIVNNQAYLQIARKIKLIENDKQLEDIIHRIYNLRGYRSVLKLADEISYIKESLKIYRLLYNKFNMYANNIDKILLANSIKNGIIDNIREDNNIKLESIIMYNNTKEDIAKNTKSYLRNCIIQGKIDSISFIDDISLLNDPIFLPNILKNLLNDIHKFYNHYNNIYSNYIDIVTEIIAHSSFRQSISAFTIVHTVQNLIETLEEQRKLDGTMLRSYGEFKLKIPDMLQILFTDNTLCIKNNFYNEYLSSKISNYNNDTNTVLLTENMYASIPEKWLLLHKYDNVFKIINLGFNQTLLADNDYFKFGRNVYTSNYTGSNDNHIDYSLWAIEIVDVHYMIKNVYFNEYLFSTKQNPDDYEILVYTALKMSDDSLKSFWRIEFCNY